MNSERRSFHAGFCGEASELFAKWEDRAVWKPFLRPTVNVNHFMTDGASPTARRTIIPRTANARLDIRLTRDTPVEAMVQIVERVVAEHQGRTPGITFTARTAGQPASYTSPDRPEFGWLLRLLAEHGDAEPVALPTLGGTLPLWVFTETLGIPVLWIPAANSDNQQHDSRDGPGLCRAANLKRGTEVHVARGHIQQDGPDRERRHAHWRSCRR